MNIKRCDTLSRCVGLYSDTKRQQEMCEPKAYTDKPVDLKVR